MRKIAWIIAAALGLSLAACGGGGGSSNSSSTANTPTNTNTNSNTNTPLTVGTTAPGALAADASAVPTAVGPGNTMSVTVTGTSLHNQPMVTIKLCTPGTTGTAACSTIPNVLVDTGSYGLRLVRSAIPDATFNTLTADTVSGQPLAECALFGSGYTWGTVRNAGLVLSGEIANTVPIQVIGDAALTTAAPSECQVGRAMATASDIGANGILGLGVSPNDCGSPCAVSALSTHYYTYSGTPTKAPVLNQVTNPVTLFAQDNNGVILEMGQVGDMGSASAQGTLVFGIDTQANNALAGTSATLISTDINGDFTSTYNGVRQSNTFFDSGSTVMFFPDSTITRDFSSSYYVPTSTVGRTITLSATSPSSVTLGFNIANAQTLNATSNNAFNDIGVYMTGQFDFGLPFFFGRHVYYGISGKSSTGGGMGPYVAYTSS
ncbi:DUF3443 domain-containing protein [Paraburkholderia sp. D15]|uniref:DUF3443 domain-containing protein n=1 Tax=Paraburkholderia sp. D15 TaxID=2880218 RepID=UPI00247A64D4|nr:DUF3443 domain-containing protein [Paraburkholderia sp. D15]WGS52234.1 DUF3443 domain-containing protein [Paraburkholderia sp. D15]WKF59481.1 hypothetical protein HUO10_003992 [Paraburkholderia busanensis]